LVAGHVDVSDAVRAGLTNAGYRLRLVPRLQQAAESARRTAADALILVSDGHTPDVVEECVRIRTDPRTERLPILILAVRAGEGDVVHGLECGADDYVVQPVSPLVLVSRIRAIVRRAQLPHNGRPLRFVRECGIQIDTVGHDVLVGTEPVPCTLTEYGLLVALARSHGAVLSREELLEQASATGAKVRGRAVDVHVLSLRRKLGSRGRCIETVWGAGYRLRRCGADDCPVLSPGSARTQSSGRHGG
jgi:two-component system, OmpR family, alkaline phosphatase synthesis response regulator PhoP